MLPPVQRKHIINVVKLEDVGIERGRVALTVGSMDIAAPRLASNASREAMLTKAHAVCQSTLDLIKVGRAVRAGVAFADFSAKFAEPTAKQA